MKKKWWKRVSCGLLSAVLTLSSVCAFADGTAQSAAPGKAESYEEGLAGDSDETLLDSGVDGNITWKIYRTNKPYMNSRKLVLSGSGRMKDYTAPNIFCDGYVHAPWIKDYFGNCPSMYGSNFNAIEIGYGITHIGDNAFNETQGRGTEIENVVIPNSVTSIGNNVFDNQVHMEYITVPDSVKTFGTSAIWRSTTVICSKDSAAYQYAVKNRLSVKVNDSGSAPKNDDPQPEAGSTAKGIPIDAAHFPDANFRAYIKDYCDYNNDGYLSDNTIPREITTVSMFTLKSKNIASLKGIEYFTELTFLDCSENQLTSLDVSKNTQLTDILCNNNNLTSLNVSNNKALKTLKCYYNKITSLDVSGNSILRTLYCFDNKLTTLNLGSKPALDQFNCAANDIRSLNVSGCPNLTFFSCHSNLLTGLDLKNNAKLEVLECFFNKFSSLNISKCPKLIEVFKSGTQGNPAYLDPHETSGIFNKKVKRYSIGVDRVLSMDTSVQVSTTGGTASSSTGNTSTSTTGSQTGTNQGQTKTPQLVIKQIASRTIVKGKTVTVKQKNKAQTIAKSKAFSISYAIGPLRFKKKSGSANLTISKLGKIKVKKGTKRGTYKIKVEVTSSGDELFLPLKKTVTVKVKVK